MARSQRKKKRAEVANPTIKKMESYMSPSRRTRTSITKMDSTGDNSDGAADTAMRLEPMAIQSSARIPRRPVDRMKGRRTAAPSSPPPQRHLMPVCTAAERDSQSLNEAKKSFQDLLIPLQLEITFLKTELQSQKDQLKTAEATIQLLEGNVSTLSAQLNVSSSELRDIVKRQEYMEGRDRKYNLRITGVPEHMEGRDCTSFMSAFLKSADKDNTLPKSFTIDRAQRVPVPSSQSNKPPRPIVMKLLTHQDKESVLRLARQGRLPDIKSSKLHVYPDYTKKLQLLRKSFTPIKAKLRSMGLNYALLFPARLRVSHQNRIHIFATLESAWHWVAEEEGKRTPDNSHPDQLPHHVINNEHSDQTRKNSSPAQDRERYRCGHFSSFPHSNNPSPFVSH